MSKFFLVCIGFINKYKFLVGQVVFASRCIDHCLLVCCAN